MSFPNEPISGEKWCQVPDTISPFTQIDRFTHDNARGPASLEELVEKEYLGSIPTDPFTGSNQTWQLETQDASLSVDSSAPQGIADVHSGSPDNSLDSASQ